MLEQRLVGVLEDARDRGFLGPGPVGFTVKHARGLASAVGAAARRFLDLGSGAGIPGLVFAGEWPDAEGVLLDSRQRSCAWMAGAIEKLGLADRLAVACGRAEELARTELREGYDLVVARSLGAPAVTAESAVGFLVRGGRLVVSEPPEQSEGRWSPEGLVELGLSRPDIRRAGEATAAVLRREGTLDERWPRRAGVPAKRPLW